MVGSRLGGFFRRDGASPLQTRVQTAGIVLLAALALSLIAVYVPHGRILCSCVGGLIALASVFEVVRLFARDRDTLLYRPVAGAIAFVILGLPAIVATVVGAQAVLGGETKWQLLYGATIVSGLALMISHVWEGRRRLEDAAHFGDRYAVAFLLLGICAPQLALVGSARHGVQLLWWVAGVAALNDVAAYFVGSWFGKRKMAPGLSPNKSVEGSVAGLTAGTLAGVGLWRIFFGEVGDTVGLVLLSLGATIAAQAGDLSKSYLKRLRGVKDTGAIFPGHGGVLDRFDAMIAIAPIALIAASLLGIE